MKLKKLAAKLLCAAFMLALLPAWGTQDAHAAPGSWDGSIASGFAGGSGKESDPYIIETGAQLAYLAKRVNGGEGYGGKYIKLMSDIDLAGRDWTPIGNDSTPFEGVVADAPFKGEFNGNGHTVSGLFVDGHTFSGLFGVLEGGAIRRLIVDGELKNGIVIGGLCGLNMGGEITGCASFVSIDAINSSRYYSTSPSMFSAGVLVGRNGGVELSGAQSRISGCFASGQVETTDLTPTGGLVGANEAYPGKPESAVIEDCFSTSDVTTTRGYTGGLVGLSSGTVSRCYSAGRVVERLNPYRGENRPWYNGAFIGSNNGRISGCYYDTSQSPKIGAAVGIGESAGGTGLTTAQMTGAAADNSMSALGFGENGAWMAGESGYPRLRAAEDSVSMRAASERATAVDSSPLPEILPADGFMWMFYDHRYQPFAVKMTLRDEKTDLLMLPTRSQITTLLGTNEYGPQNKAFNLYDVENPYVFDYSALKSLSMRIEADWLELIDGVATFGTGHDLSTMAVTSGYWKNANPNGGPVEFTLFEPETYGDGYPVFRTRFLQDGAELNTYDFRNPFTITVGVAIDYDYSGDFAMFRRTAEGDVLIPNSVLSGNCVLARAYAPGTFVAKEVEGQVFADTAGLWMSDAVRFMSARGIVNGVGGGLFEPNAPLTRAHFVTMLMRTLAIDSTLDAEKSFADENAIPAWALPHAKQALALGIAWPDENGNFSGSEAIAREETFELLYRAIRLLDSEWLKNIGQAIIHEFSDWDELSPEYVEAAEFMVRFGLAQGYDNALHPKDPLTRAEAAQVLWNYID